MICQTLSQSFDLEVWRSCGNFRAIIGLFAKVFLYYFLQKSPEEDVLAASNGQKVLQLLENKKSQAFILS